VLSSDTKATVLRCLIAGRYAHLLDMNKEDCAFKLPWNSFNEMTDEEIVEEYVTLYNLSPENDELYDTMLTEMAIHKLLTPTVSNNLSEAEKSTEDK